MNNQKNYKKT